MFLSAHVPIPDWKTLELQPKSLKVEKYIKVFKHLLFLVPNM